MIILISLRKGKETMKKIMIVNYEPLEKENFFKGKKFETNDKVITYLSDEEKEVDKIIQEKAEHYIRFLKELKEKETLYMISKFSGEKAAVVTDSKNIDFLKKLTALCVGDIFYILNIKLKSEDFQEIPKEIEKEMEGLDLSEWDIFFKFKGKEFFRGKNAE